MRIKFQGPVALAAATGVILDLLPLARPELAVWCGLVMGAIVGSALLWLAWTWFIAGERVDRRPSRNLFEASRQSTGAVAVFAKGTASWILTAGFFVALFLWLHPTAWWALPTGAFFAAGFGAAGVALYVRRVPPR